MNFYIYEYIIRQKNLAICSGYNLHTLEIYENGL